MRIKENIKIREEDGFFLLINLNETSILQGFPSFFKINGTTKEIVEFLRKDTSEESVLEYCISTLGMHSNQMEVVKGLITKMKELDLLYE